MSRPHPETGEPVWYNQFAAHHLASSAWTYPRIFRMRPSLHHFAHWQLVRLAVALKRQSSPDTLAYFCTYADGSPIPDDDVRALLDTMWRHTVITPWQRGDVLAIDNRAVAHGRPAVSWRAADRRLSRVSYARAGGCGGAAGSRPSAPGRVDSAASGKNQVSATMSV